MNRSDQHSNSGDDYRQGARNRKIFTASDDTFGLPSNVFIGCCAAVLGTFLMFSWYAAVIVGFIVVPVMYRIHKEDPRALSLWQDVMTNRHTSWEAGRSTPRELIILNDR